MLVHAATILVGLASVVSATAAASESHPFKLIDNLVFVPVTIDGHRGWGVVDSGTTGIGIDSGFAHRRGIKQGRKLGTADVSGPNAPVLHEALVRSVTTHGRSLDASSTFLIDAGAYTRSAGSSVDAILGEPFFRDQIVTIDYPRHLITVRPSGSGAARCADPIRFELVQGVPVVAGTAAFADRRTARLRLMVDLGTRHHAVLFGGGFLATPEGRTLSVGPQRRLGTGAGGGFTGWSSAMRTLRIGAGSHPRTPYAATAHGSSGGTGFYDGTLGVPFWRRGSITLDYGSRLLCLPR